MLSYMKSSAFKQLQFLAKSLILGLFLFLPFVSSAKIKTATLCMRALDHMYGLPTLANDILNVPAVKAYVKESRCTREFVTDLICSSDEPEIKSLEDFFKVAFRLGGDLHVLRSDWSVVKLKVTHAGSNFMDRDNEIYLSDLIQYYEQSLEKPYSDIAVKTLKALLNYNQVMDWVKQVNEEVLREMWKEGLKKESHIKNLVIRAHYLDQILAKRAISKGFKAKSDGMPYEMTSVNSYSFHYTLARGRFFVDWVGEDIGSTDEEAKNKLHGARGHTLAMAYLADHVPDFVELVKYIGRTQDRKGIWGQMFDNALSTSTPFWGGFWVINFSKYLYIPN